MIEKPEYGSDVQTTDCSSCLSCGELCAPYPFIVAGLACVINIVQTPCDL